jgi:AcrR family transcriptional regulator
LTFFLGRSNIPTVGLFKKGRSAITEKLSKEVRIRSILDAAMHEFTEKGYDGTSMERIAVSAGLSKGGIYHHFASKDEILSGLNDSFQDAVAEAVRDAFEKPDCAETLRYFIKEYLHFWMTHRQEIQVFLMFMTRAVNNPAMWRGLRDYYTREIDLFEHVYSKGMESGEFLPHDARSMAITLTSALDGIISFLLSVPGFPMEQVLCAFNHSFIECLRASSPEKESRK